MEMLSNVKEGYESFLSSLSELGALNVSYVEKLANKQMENTKFVADLGIEQLKALSKVDSLEAVQSLPSSTLEMGTRLARKTMEESKALMDTGSNYKTEVTELFKKKKGKAA